MQKQDLRDLVPDSVVICIYGAPKVGKTVDTGFAFPNALFVSAPGALSSIQSVCGYTPRSVDVKNLAQASELIDAVAGKFDTIVFDDFSYLAERTFSELESRYTGFKLWGKLRDEALNFRNKARHGKVHVVMNCWEQTQKIKDNGAKVRGGPMLAGRLPEQIPSLCDIVLRATHEPKRLPWPSAYRCNMDPLFIMGDRWHVADIADPAPMNLGEILRAGALPFLPRHKDFPKQEDRVENISKALSGNLRADIALINEVYVKLIAADVSVVEAKWTLRDAVDRAVIRRAMSINASHFIDPSTTMSL